MQTQHCLPVAGSPVPLGLGSREIANDAGAVEDVATSCGRYHCVIERLSPWLEIADRLQGRKRDVESVDREDILMAQGSQCRRRTRPIVAKVSEVIGDLRTVAASGNARTLGKGSRRGSDVIHTPVGK